MDEIMRLRNIAWEAIGSAMVDRSECDRYWQAWTAHCRLYPNNLGSRLSASETTDRLLTFAVAVREGQFGLGDQDKVQSVDGLCGMSPKGSFWTDTLTHDVPPWDSTPLTSQ